MEGNHIASTSCAGANSTKYYDIKGVSNDSLQGFLSKFAKIIKNI